MKISEILHKAADKHLIELSSGDPRQYWASCNAVKYGAGDPSGAAIEFLNDCGVDSASAFQFRGFDTTEERQGARYLWLKFAALVAEDEGL